MTTKPHRDVVAQRYASHGYAATDAPGQSLKLGDIRPVTKAAADWARRHPDPCNPFRKRRHSAQ